MTAPLAFEIISTLVVQVLVVTLVTIGLQRRVADARGACQLWTTCFVLILVMIAAGFLLPHRRLVFLPTSLPSQTVLSLVIFQTWLTAILASVWIAGVAIMLFNRIKAYWQLWHFTTNRCTLLSASEIASLPLDWDGVEGRLMVGETRSPSLQVLISNDIAGPFCYQLHRPVIVLPRYVIDGDQVNCRHILLHELEHLKTKHPMQHFLQGMCSVLLWFHPAMRTASRAAELAREYLCDEAAVSRDGKLPEYLRTLANVAEHCRNQPDQAVPHSALAFGNQKSCLMLRCERLMKLTGRTAVGHSLSPSVAVAALLLCALIVNQLWLPTNALATNRSHWSPWPAWTANALHDFNITVRDFEIFDERIQMHELLNGD